MINPAELDLQEENVIRVTRVAKVTSRGKNFRFGALVVVGDGKVMLELAKAKPEKLCLQLIKLKKKQSKI